MHVIFINYNRFVESSGIHIHFLANELVRRGIGCTVCIPYPQERPEIFGPCSYNIVQFNDMRNLSFLDRLRMKLRNPILHAWTPRENVRSLTRALSRSLFCRYYVHLEDNEESILEKEFGLPFAAVQALPREELDGRLRAESIHPHFYRSFMEGAAGVTCIIDTLKRFVPDGVPAMTFWPACEEEFFRMQPEGDASIRQRLDLKPGETVIAYTGNMHPTNAADVTSLYEAVGFLNEQGHAVTLLRSGTDSSDYTTDVSAVRERYVREYGSCTAAENRDYIAAADIIVQPGSAGEFNDYRFPSKLPMALASGRPVILPATNIGRYLEDGVNCLHIRDGNAEELAGKIRILIDDPALRVRIGIAGREFARENFSWEKSAQAILDFYQETRPPWFRRWLP